MDPNKSKPAQTSSSAGPSGIKQKFSQQILKSFRVKPSSGGASLPPSAALPPITTSLPTPINPFDYSAPNSDPISPFYLQNVEPASHNDYSAHFAQLRKPLPATYAAREDVIKDKIPRIKALSAAVQRQSSPQLSFSQDVPLAEVFKLCTQLLTAEQPQSLRIEVCNLLTHSVKLADQRSASASKALSEIRTGASGSLSSKVPDSDQPLADIDRALFYRLVLTLSASELDDSGTDNTKVVLTGLPSQLRALEVLTKDGRDVVGFPDLLMSLTQWLSIAWKEVQSLRAECRKLQQQREKYGESRQERSAVDQHQKSEVDVMAKLTSVEWDVQATLHLLTSILKYSFPRIPLAHAEMALRSTAVMILGEVPEKKASRQTVGSPALKATPLMGPIRARDRTIASVAKRSKSKDARPLMDGYSYYGLETIITSSGSENTSPSMTPRQGAKTSSGEAGSSTGLTPSALSSSLSAAPITLATIAPSRDASTSTSHQVAEGPEGPWYFGPEIHIAEVRSVLKLLDATLRYGYLPPACVDVVMCMLCRLLGYPLVDANQPDLISRDIKSEDQAWRNEAWPIFSHILRGHCANAAIRAVRQLLVESGDSSPSTHGPEDPAVLVGALSFFRSAMAHISEFEAEKTLYQSTGSSSKPQAEDALAPSLSLSLIMPALRGALRRKCDLLDLEVLNLVADLVPSKPGYEEISGETTPRPPALQRVATSAFTHGDWDALLDLTVEARRHVEGWKLRGAALSPFTITKQVRNDSGSRPRVTSLSEEPSPAVHAMVGVLSRLHLAPPPRGGDEEEDDAPQRRFTERQDQGYLPWTPKLAALLLSLASILPDSTIVDLVRYYRSQHLCLPSNPDWMSNIRGLLQAFYHRHEQMLEEFGATPAPQARRKLVSLVFDHVYGAVQDMNAERNLLMTEIILPLANSTLLSEADPDIEKELRRVLVHAAVLSGSRIPGPIDSETDQEQEPVREQALDAEGLEEVFVEVRQLLCRVARNGGARASPRTDSTSAQPRTMEPLTSTHSKNDTLQPAEPVDGKISPDTKASNAAVDLISIFNRMAFNTPWIASSVDSEVDKAVRKKWGKQTRAGCIAIVRDLLELLKPATRSNGDPSEKGTPSKRTETPAKSDTTETASVPVGSIASVRTRLIILEWFVRFRTDRQHRVYLVGDMDELTASDAKLLKKGPPMEDEDEGGVKAPRESATAVEMERQRSSKVQSATRNGGEREGREMQRGADAVNRSKSRLRELSCDRGPQERGNDSSRRAVGERNRSASQNHKRTWTHEALWRLPIKVSFEMPTINLRSDIIYTYIYQTHDRECCPGQIHLLTEDDALPAPLPISELLATSISIMAHEQDWELLSYLICHLPHQLSNKHLFSGPKAQVQVVNLRRMLCEGILQGNLFPNLVLPKDIKKTDVYAVIYGTLTVLLGYRKLFSRPEQDEMVEAFMAGLNKSQNTAQPCVRALSVACYELQKSFTRLLSGMLVKLSTVMSSMTMSVHILELIMAVAHIPACYANLTEADYRRVFGIALQYIQYHQSTAATTRDDWKANPASFSLSQYVMMMAYYNIALWFMTLKISDRPKHVPYISRGLLLANDGMDKLADQTEVIFDFLARTTHSNADPKPKRSFINNVIMGPSSVGPGKSKDGNRASKTWLMGKGLITVTSLKREGWVEILVRRPSGTTAMLCKLENVKGMMLPDENGEQIDLPAALMMNRDPDVMRAPTLLAPGEIGGRTIRQRVEDRLRLNEPLNARRPLGPAHFGLARKPRAASFSGGLSGSAFVASTESTADRGSEASDPYKQPSEQVKEAEDGAVKRQNSREGTEAMKEVMREILSEDIAAPFAGESGKQSSGVGNGAAKPVSAARLSTKDAGVDPGFVAIQLSSFPDMAQEKCPILLPDEPATDRMIRAVDLTPVVDFHKIGVLYVGPGQEKEVDILGNHHGSPAYMRFLSSLGNLITLKGQEDVYTGGLDRYTDDHGKYAYVWTDEISQIIYHTATLMPNKSYDANHAAKKALIGNDWVHIVFNESGHEYKFGTIPSQFNFVNVCISPNSRGGANLGSAAPNDAVFYRVSLQTRPGLPDFSPVGDGQLISAEALPAFVRILALTSNLMSQIYLDTGEAMQPYTSNWVSRLHHVQRFKTQLEAKRKTDTSQDDPVKSHDLTRTF